MKQIKIYKGNLFTNIMSNTHVVSVPKKVITFDLDETLGSFQDMYLLWNYIYKNLPVNELNTYTEYEVFCHIMDIFPEFLRYGIINILGYLYHKKISGECSQIYLYTNNQCFGEDNSKWISLIVQYFNGKVQTNPSILLFDQIICAFKINNQVIEHLRTTQNKTYNDLIRCTLLPKTVEICFVDNTYHKKMLNDRVYYIQPKSYEHNLSIDEIVNRFERQWKFTKLPKMFSPNLYNYFLSIPRKHTNESSSIDLIVSKKIMYHLKEFFLLTTRTKTQKTKKISLGLGRFTKKKRTHSTESNL